MSHSTGLEANDLRETPSLSSSGMATQVYTPSQITTPFFPSTVACVSTSPKAAHVAPLETPSQLKQDPVLVTSDARYEERENAARTAHSSTAAAQPATATLDIAEHSQTELLVMLSSLLTKITTSNDSLHAGPDSGSPPKAGSPLLAFHARNIPSISIQSYLTRILKYCPMSSDIFLSLLVYFDRMSKLPIVDHTAERPTFSSTRQLMGNEHHPFSIDSYNVHRLVITGIVVASKFCSDVFYTNSRYAKVGGLPLSELNHLEFQFLLMNDFRLMIPMEELQRYGDQLLNFWQNETASAATGTAAP